MGKSVSMLSDDTRDGAVGGELVPGGHLVPGRVPVRNLAPLPADLDPQVRIFTETIRSLYGTLGISLTRFATQVHSDKSVVSRYMSGDRLPPRDFIDKLLKAVFDKKGRPVTPDLQELVEAQFLAALKARNPTQYRVQDLSNRLRMAIEEKQQCEAEIAALSEAMHSRQEEIYRLEMEKREIRAAWASAQQTAEVESEKGQQHRHELQQAIEKLEQEVARLRKRLQSAQRRAKTAEQRCQRLEQELDAASVNADEQSAEELTRMREQLRTSEELLAQASQRFAEVRGELDEAKAEAAVLASHRTELERTRTELENSMAREQQLTLDLEQMRQHRADPAGEGFALCERVLMVYMVDDRKLSSWEVDRSPTRLGAAMLRLPFESENSASRPEQ